MQDELRACQTIICNALDVANNNNSDKAILSRNLLALEYMKNYRT